MSKIPLPPLETVPSPICNLVLHKKVSSIVRL